MTNSTAVAQRGSRQVATNDGNPLVTFRRELEQRAEDFKMVLPAHITPEKFQRTILTAVQSDPDILTANRRSLITSCFKAAQDGLLPDKREAALVIFNTRQKNQGSGQWETVKLVQYMPMVFGLRKKILQSGEIKDIQANVVYRQEIEAGLFIYEEGTERMLRHKPLLDTDFDPQDADIAAAYSVATFTDGTMSFEVMRRSEINKVREKSQTGALYDRNGKPREPSGPWVEWFSEMAKKTVIRRHSKTLPMSGDLLDLIASTDEDLLARSATGLLGSVQEDEPTVLPGRDDLVDHDPETGEIIDGDAQDVTDEEEQASNQAGPLEEPTLDEAKDALASCKSVDAVNAELKKLRPFFQGDDLDDLNMAGAEQIDVLLRPDQGKRAA